ncbi:MAG: hypothetical protein ABI599_18530 [Flavobacteriales bacterium]
MLSRSKRTKLEQAIRSFRLTHLSALPSTFDERIARHRTIAFLSDVLGFVPVSDIRSEARMRGPADLALLVRGERHVLVGMRRPGVTSREEQTARILRFAVIEGIDWLLFVEGGLVILYRVKYEGQGAMREVFTVDLSETMGVNTATQMLQFMQKDVVSRNGLELLWNRTIALDPENLAALLCSSPVVNYLQRTLRTRAMSNFTEDEVMGSVKRVLMDGIRPECVGADALGGAPTTAVS